MTVRGRVRLAGAILVAVLASPLLAPRLLAFPYTTRVGPQRIHAERPMPPRIGLVVSRANALVAASPLGGLEVGREIYLTDGGWRWRWLSLGNATSLALTRPLSPAIVINGGDVSSDLARPATTTTNRRTLSGVIAHEMTHQLIRARYGILFDLWLPEWKREGYPDFVARESTLTDAAAARLVAATHNDPALGYYLGRQRVAATLRANGNSVDRLLRDAH